MMSLHHHGKTKIVGENMAARFFGVDCNLHVARLLLLYFESARARHRPAGGFGRIAYEAQEVDMDAPTAKSPTSWQSQGTTRLPSMYSGSTTGARTRAWS